MRITEPTTAQVDATEVVELHVAAYTSTIPGEVDQVYLILGDLSIVIPCRTVYDVLGKLQKAVDVAIAEAGQ